MAVGKWTRLNLFWNRWEQRTLAGSLLQRCAVVEFLDPFAPDSGVLDLLPGWGSEPDGQGGPL